MNICYKTYYFTLIFLISEILILLFLRFNNKTKNFVDVLDIEKRNIYNKITNERMMIYIKSIFLGLIISLIYMFLIPKDLFIKPKNYSKSFIIAISLIIFYLTTYFSYILHPKTDYMVLHLDSEVQKLEWVKVYKYMQFYYHLSFVIGFIGVSILYTGIC